MKERDKENNKWKTIDGKEDGGGLRNMLMPKDKNRNKNEGPTNP